MVQEKEDRRVKRKIQSDDAENAQTYSNVVSSSLTESPPPSPSKENEFSILSSKIKSANEIYRESLSNISPSTISDDFKSYSQIDFENDDSAIASPDFGIYHASLVELFLKQMVYDERIIVGIILYGNSIQRKQQNLYKKFSTSFICNDCDAPISPEFPELPPLPQYNRSIWKPKLLKKS
jgi:hypothetical protein